MITINPNNPSSDNRVEILFSSGGCPDSQEQSRIGNDFEFSVEFTGNCQFGLPPYFGYTWNVGRLEPGTYNVTFRTGFVGGGGAQLYQESFSVSQGIEPFPVPAPILPTAALVLLTAMLAVTAFAHLRKYGL